MTNCWYCQSEMIRGADFDFADYSLEGDGIISVLSCQDCGAEAEFKISTDV